MKKSFLLLLVMVGLLVGAFLHKSLPLRANPLNLVARAPQSVVQESGLWYYPSGVPEKGCAVNSQPDLQVRFTRGTLNLARFRSSLQSAQWSTSVPAWLKQYQPPEKVALAHPTNFGERFQKDITGQSAARVPVIVLHETVMSGWKTVKFFQTAHYNGANQASYHALVKRDGTIYYLVPPDKRAFGAGDSIFYGPNGAETTRTTRSFPPSVNNFAYHVSLESPPDGINNGNTHSGYTDAQYTSLAWLVAKTGVPENRITTHQGVDRSGSRRDPRSFDRSKFSNLLRAFPKTREISIGCWRY